VTADEIRRWFAIADDKTVSLSDRKAALLELAKAGADRGETGEEWLCSSILLSADTRYAGLQGQEKAAYAAKWARLIELVDPAQYRADQFAGAIAAQKELEVL
jgi:hypothetical protein